MSRAYAVVVSLAFCAAVLWPLPEAFGARRWDSFPLSWYPMFSDPRGGRERVLHVVGLDAGGEQHLVSAVHWTRGGFNQGSMQLSRAEKAGREALAEVCGEIARGVARDRKLAAVDRVVVLESRFDPARYFGEGDHRPLSQKMLVRCPVTR